MKILLTNDDSHRSPLLEFVIEKLKPLGDLLIVVPKHEQSWKGKSMTRFGYLHAAKIELWGAPAFTVDGTPADCINLGVHHLSRTRPDLVVSGINAGLNTGTAFVLSSGTVGACFEANIAGIPAIALSQRFDTSTRNRYLGDYSLSDATSRHLRAQASKWIDAILAAWITDRRLAREPITWNINFPFKPAAREVFQLVPLAVSRYGSCFKKRSLRYEHEVEKVFDDKRAKCDQSVIMSGHVSVTPIDMRTFGQFTARAPVALGRRFVREIVAAGRKNAAKSRRTS